jgi:hypothetical protein
MHDFRRGSAITVPAIPPRFDPPVWPWACGRARATILSCFRSHPNGKCTAQLEEPGCLTRPLSPVDLAADSLGLRPGQDLDGDRQILDGDAERFEEGYILRMGASRVTAHDHLA